MELLRHFTLPSEIKCPVSDLYYSSDTVVTITGTSPEKYINIGHSKSYLHAGEVSGLTTGEVKVTTAHGKKSILIISDGKKYIIWYKINHDKNQVEIKSETDTDEIYFDIHKNMTRLYWTLIPCASKVWTSIFAHRLCKKSWYIKTWVVDCILEPDKHIPGLTIPDRQTRMIHMWYENKTPLCWVADWRFTNVSSCNKRISVYNKTGAPEEWELFSRTLKKYEGTIFMAMTNWNTWSRQIKQKSKIMIPMHHRNQGDYEETLAFSFKNSWKSSILGIGLYWTDVVYI
ncbi:hypothetical protein [Salmon gill poxvirus]